MSKECPLYGKLALYLDCLECEEKYCKKGKTKMKYNKIVIGIDQSYKRTGITIIADDKIKKITSIDFQKGFKNNSEKREYLRKYIDKLFSNMKEKSNEIIVIVERIRLRSEGFLNIDYIKSIGALNSILIDAAYTYNYPIYSADTRAWKSKIVGTSKPMENKYYVDPKKWPTIKYICSIGYEKEILIKLPEHTKIKKCFEIDGQKYVYNDDAADSCCIALYGNLPLKETTLKEEK